MPHKKPDTATKRPAKKPVRKKAVKRTTVRKAAPKAITQAPPARTRNLRPAGQSGHRRVAGQGQDDQQVPRAGFKVLASYGHVRDLPAAARRARKSPASTSRRLEAPLPRRRPRRQRAAEGAPLDQGHPRRAEARGRPGEPGLPGDRPRPRGRGDRLAHRRRTEAADRSGPSASRSTRSPRRRCKNALRPPRDRSTWTASAAQEARRAIDRVVGFPLSQPARQEGDARPERRPRAVGRGAADRRPRARDRGVQDGGILEDHRAAAPQGWRGDSWTADPAKSKIFAKKKGAGRRPTWPSRRRDTPDDDEPE